MWGILPRKEDDATIFLFLQYGPRLIVSTLSSESSDIYDVKIDLKKDPQEM